jgi:Tfp pilus assembly protein PilO
MLQHDPDRKLRILGKALHGAGLAVALAVVGLGYALAHRPMDRDADDCQSRIATLQTLLADSAKVRAEHAALRRALDETTAKTLALEKRVPRDPAEAEFLSQLSGAAEESGLVIRDYRPGVVRKRENHSCLEIQLACTGSFRAICRFLDRMASLPRLSQVTQIEMASAGEAKTYPVTMSVVVFFDLHEPPAAGPRLAPKTQPLPARAGA